MASGISFGLSVGNLKKAFFQPSRGLTKLAYNAKRFLFGHQNYVRFVVVSRSRTGSNLLRSYLNNSGVVLCEGEILGDSKGKSIPSTLRSLWSAHPKKIKAVGFKMFYYHPVGRNSDFLSEECIDLVSRENVKVIHLLRENSLASVISKYRAMQTSKWQERSLESRGREKTNQNLRLDPYLLEEEIRNTSDAVAQIRNIMHGKERYTEITYEDLITGNSQAFGEISLLLGVPGIPMETHLRKQSANGYASYIENWEELVQYFSQTEFAWMTQGEFPLKG